MRRTTHTSNRRAAVAAARGFTLVELLVVIGIIALLVAILLPVVIAARARANAIVCQSNARQLNMAILTYATVFRAFPPNTLTQRWLDTDRVGQFFRATAGSADIRGRAAACPDDPGAVRSYSMNVWASSKYVDDSLVKSGTGRMWGPWSRPASQLILLAESWSAGGPERFGWTTEPYIGYRKATPGQRFGGGTGLQSLISEGRWGMVNCELAYLRHRPSKSPGRGLQPIGRVTIAYADGHVALKSESDLYDPVTGLSRLDSLWSPMDYELNQ